MLFLSTITSIIRQIPKAINIRINRLSSSKRYLIIIKNSIMKPYITAVIKKSLSTLKPKKHYNNRNNILENHITHNNNTG